jgi:glycosyltransferase involved in cell wall biosynthesis
VKVLHVIPSVELGGAERLLVELAQGQLSRGDDVTVASSGGRLEQDLQSVGARTIRIPLRERSLLTTLRASAALARRSLRPDVVHSHNVRAAVAAKLSVSRPRSGIPHVVTVHGISHGDSRLSARLLSVVADAVVAVAEAEARQLRSTGLRIPVRVIPNAVSPPTSRDRTESRRRLDIDPDVPVALCIARLAPLKRHDLLLDAWSRLPAPTTLLCAGEGSLMHALEQQAARLGISDRVRFLGPRADIDWLLAASDLVTLASDREGLPMSVIEAMTAGVPVVATRVGGLAEIVVPGAGLLVPPGDATALAGALSVMLSDHEWRRSASEVARSHAREQHSVDALVASYADLYDRLRHSAGGRAGRVTTGR